MGEMALQKVSCTVVDPTVLRIHAFSCHLILYTRNQIWPLRDPARLLTFGLLKRNYVLVSRPTTDDGMDVWR